MTPHKPHPRPDSILELWTHVPALPEQLLLPARETNLYLHSVMVVEQFKPVVPVILVFLGYTGRACWNLDLGISTLMLPIYLSA